jgi:hypothetical protein
LKSQPTWESSISGSEFVVAKTGMEKNRGLHYKLQKMGIPLLGSTSMFGDNLSMITNTALPESMLKKKFNSICCHVVHELAAMGKIMMTWEPTLMDPANIVTKKV